MSESADWLTEAIATGALGRVKPNQGAAGERVNDARRHVRSARALADNDPTLAVAVITQYARR